MVRPPATIKAALLAGFLVIFTMWLASTYYFTGRLAESQAQSAAIHARYARGQELLFAVRSQVLLGSIYVRDALIEINQPSTAAAVARDQLSHLQAQVNQGASNTKRSTRWSRAPPGRGSNTNFASTGRQPSDS